MTAATPGSTAMMAAGALAEVEALAARNLSPALPALKAVGYPELAAHLRGEPPLPQAIAAAQRETRRYAKRQSTWLRGQMARLAGDHRPRSRANNGGSFLRSTPA